MRSRRINLMAALLMGISSAALAGVAETSATAGSNGRGAGTAAATANYDGAGIGLTRTDAHSGRLNVARGLSVGLDADGLSISHSYAVAGRVGPAVGGTFNLHLGADGEHSFSAGRVTAEGDRERSVTAGGAIGENHGRGVAVAHASGETGDRGRVEAETRASESRSRDRYAERGGRYSERGRDDGERGGRYVERGERFTRGAGAIRAVLAGPRSHR